MQCWGAGSQDFLRGAGKKNYREPKQLKPNLVGAGARAGKNPSSRCQGAGAVKHNLVGAGAEAGKNPSSRCHRSGPFKSRSR